MLSVFFSSQPHTIAAAFAPFLARVNLPASSTAAFIFVVCISLKKTRERWLGPAIFVCAR
jgi:hypothetical protein